MPGRSKMDEMRPEYKATDFAELERGKSHEAVAKTASVGLLDPELAKVFPTSKAVNEALRGLLALTSQTARLTRRSTRSRTKPGAD